jgi:hypothetical protein
MICGTVCLFTISRFLAVLSSGISRDIWLQAQYLFIWTQYQTVALQREDMYMYLSHRSLEGRKGVFERPF